MTCHLTWNWTWRNGINRIVWGVGCTVKKRPGNRRGEEENGREDGNGNGDGVAWKEEEGEGKTIAREPSRERVRDQLIHFARCPTHLLRWPGSQSICTSIPASRSSSLKTAFHLNLDGSGHDHPLPPSPPPL